MDNQERKQLIRYIRPPSVALKLAIAVMLSGLILFFICFAINHFVIEAGSVTLIILFVIIALLCLLVSKSENDSLKKNIRTIEQNPTNAKQLFSDFTNGDKNLPVILGENYIIGYQTGTIVSYEQISEIYSCSNNRRTVLKAMLFKENTVNLCRLSPDSEKNMEIAEIINGILKKNNRINVGNPDKT